MNNKSDKAYIIVLSIGVIGVVLGLFTLNLILIVSGIGLTCVGIALRKSVKLKCQRCGKLDAYVEVNREILDRQLKDYKYIQHNHSEGVHVVRELAGQYETKSYKYYDPINRSGGPQYHDGYTRTNEYRYRNVPYVHDTFQVFDYSDVAEKHRVTMRCKYCGHIIQFIQDQKYQVQNLPVSIRKQRNSFDETIQYYLNQGYEFKSNLPQLNGIGYKKACEIFR